MPKRNLDINETADSILQTLSPTEFHDLVEITHELSAFASVVSKNTDRACLEGDDELYRQRLTSAASLISELAEKYSSYLATIKRRFPNFYEIAPSVKPLYKDDDDEIS